MAAINVLSSHRDELGESPQWLAREQLLQRVDIRGRTVYRTDPFNGTEAAHRLSDDVGFALPRRDGDGMLAGCGRSIVRLERWGADAETVASVEPDLPDNRFNDAKVDPAGRLWAGTMSTRREPGAAALYRVDAAGEIKRVLAGATISNGLDWNDDATVMYYVDSTTQRIDAFGFDLAKGALGARRRFAEIPARHGLPDGLAVDAEGGIWVALFGGGRLRRYTTDGVLDAELMLPVSCPTSIAFGGPDLRTLFVTTARHKLDARGRRREPLAGAVLLLVPGVAGRAGTRAAL